LVGGEREEARERRLVGGEREEVGGRREEGKGNLSKRLCCIGQGLS